METICLTKRQFDIVRELCKDGAENKVIAKRLFISENSVKTHLSQVMKQVTFSSRAELAVAVIRGNIAVACKLPPGHQVMRGAKCEASI